MDQPLDCKQVRDSDLIEGYLDETLSPALKENFEKHYLGCQECFEELQFRHALRLEMAGADSPGKLHAFAPRSAPTRPRWLWAVAALILLSVIPLSLLLYRQSSPQLPPLLMEIQEMPAYVESTVRGGQAEALTEGFNRGMQAYQAQDYATSAQLLAEVARQYPEHQPTAFYLGVSALAVNEPEQAVQSLTRVITSPGSPYLEEARWYLAKSYFRLGRIEEGREQLEAIRAAGGAFAEDAELHLKVLEEALSQED